MVDEARVVPADCRVNDHLVVDDEEERVVPRHLLVVIAAVRLVIANPFACILDDPLTAADKPRRERAVPLDL